MLFEHFFTSTSHAQPRVVARLVVTPEELASAAGAPKGEAGAVRESFIDALRCPPREFRKRLSIDALRPDSWDRSQLPPFFVYLVLTCFAAAALDGKNITEGDFRERLRLLLNHPPETPYPLDGLAILWKNLAVWLQDRRKAGAHYRALELPDPGWMTRIGYSIRLAFPSRRDRVQLHRILSVAGLPRILTVPEVFQVLGRARDHFSADFQRVFDAARSALARNDDVPELSALWSAVLEVLTLVALVPHKSHVRVRYQLLLQDDDLFQPQLCLVATEKPGKTSGVQFAPLDESLGDYRYLVRSQDGSARLIVKLLFMGALDERIPRLVASPVVSLLAQGVVLFQQAGFATWELAPLKPAEGLTRAMVAAEKAHNFARLLPNGSRLKAQPTSLDGWVHIGPFDAANLAAPSRSLVPELREVRCLQPLDIGTQIYIVGGIRVDGGYLGVHQLLPNVRCTGADRVCLRRAGDAHNSSAELELPWDEEEAVFSTRFIEEDIEGAFVVEATKKGLPLDARDVVFHSRVLTWKYAQPTAPQYLLAEAAKPDVLPWSEADNAFLAGGGRRNTQTGRWPPDSDQYPDKNMLAPAIWSSDHERFVEALAALSARRKGVSESEIINLLSEATRIEADYTIWNALRSWLEAGYFDVVTRRHWRGRLYFGREPRLVVVPAQREEPRMRVTLFGLAPLRLREQAAAAFQQIGALPSECSGFSIVTPAPPVWWADSQVDLNAVAAKLNMGRPQVCGSIEDLLYPITDVIPLRDAPRAGYEYEGTWDWNRGGFRRLSPGVGAGSVRIDWYLRDDRPDQFVVIEPDQQVRVSLSRNWALLFGFARAHRSAFQPLNARCLLREGNSGPYVPLPVARSLFLHTGVVSGPRDGHAGDSGYAYGVYGAMSQRRLLDWLNGAKSDPMLLRRLSWLLEAAFTRRGRADIVSLPNEVANHIQALLESTDLRARIPRRVPRDLLPHIRRAVGLLIDSQ